jgi:hypothetical protein
MVMAKKSKAEPWDSVPTPWKRISYRIHHGLKNGYTPEWEEIRGEYFRAIMALGWGPGMPLGIVHRAVRGRVASHAHDAMDPEHRAIMEGINRAIPKGRRL